MNTLFQKMRNNRQKAALRAMIWPGSQSILQMKEEREIMLRAQADTNQLREKLFSYLAKDREQPTKQQRWFKAWKLFNTGDKT